MRSILISVAEPVQCAVCGGEAGIIPVCRGCREKYFSVEGINSGTCSICGRKLISEENVCMQCRTEPLLKHADGVFSLFPYRLWNTILLCRWKMEDERALSAFFAELAAEKLRQIEALYGKFALVPVPPRPGKIRKKGWDQVDELCTFLEYRYGFCVKRILNRKTLTEQKKLDRVHRLETVKTMYALKSNVKKIPDCVCLIDDVMTTGATAEGCCSRLKAAGAARVFIMTLFTVD